MKDKRLVSKRRADESTHLRKLAPTEDSAFDRSEKGAGFTRADFEAALKKVARKIDDKERR